MIFFDETSRVNPLLKVSLSYLKETKRRRILLSLLNNRNTSQINRNLKLVLDFHIIISSQYIIVELIEKILQV